MGSDLKPQKFNLDWLRSVIDLMLKFGRGEDLEDSLRFCASQSLRYSATERTAETTRIVQKDDANISESSSEASPKRLQLISSGCRSSRFVRLSSRCLICLFFTHESIIICHLHHGEHSWHEGSLAGKTSRLRFLPLHHA